MPLLAKNAVITTVCLIFFCSLTAPDVCGFAPRGKDNKPKRERFTGTGTVEALLPNAVIKFTMASKEIWHVKLEAPKRQRDPKTRRYVFKGGTDIQVTGTAEPSFLRTGMYVRFSAGFDARGKSSDVISLLTIFSPNESRKVGIFREGFAEGGKEAGAKTQFLVAGQLANFKNGKMSVVVGGKKIQIAVAEDVKINVDVSDPSLAKQGDKIEIKKGYYFQKGAVFGEIVEIELSEPLVGKTKKSRRSSSKKKPQKKSSEKPKSKEE
jgi:hypothetical protein